MTPLILRRALSLLIDATLVFLGVLLFKGATGSALSASPVTLLVWTAVIAPLVIYFQTRYFGKSLGHWISGVRRLNKLSGKRPQRLYDWVFESQTLTQESESLPLGVQLLAVAGLITLAFGLLFFAAAKDPLLRRLKEISVPLYAPIDSAKEWRVTPWYYASGAWPTTFQGNPVLYSLPYEKGPPYRFVGKIQSYWGKSGIRVTLVGPLTIKGVGTRAELKECFTQMFGCTSLRREVFERPLAPFTELADADKVQWITVDNPLLNEEERPEGLYLRGKSKSGETIEAYFLVNSRMTFQGYILHRYENDDGLKASALLAQAIGSMRISPDLEGSKAWVNQSLSKVDIRHAFGDESLLFAQGLLLSKVSVDPISFDPFYYLAETAYLLFKSANQRHDLEAAASSKAMVLSAHKYATDIAPDDERMKEMDLFKANVDKF